MIEIIFEVLKFIIYFTLGSMLTIILNKRKSQKNDIKTLGDVLNDKDIFRSNILRSQMLYGINGYGQMLIITIDEPEDLTRYYNNKVLDWGSL